MCCGGREISRFLKSKQGTRRKRSLYVIIVLLIVVYMFYFIIAMVSYKLHKLMNINNKITKIRLIKQQPGLSIS